MVFVFFLTSFSMIISRSTHVSINGIIPFFLWLNNILLYTHTRARARAHTHTHTTSSLSIHLSWTLGCFHMIFRNLDITAAWTAARVD